MKKISMLFCAGLFAAAITSGCKKDDKGGAAAGGDTCEALGAKMSKEAMTRLPKDAPAEAKKMAEEMSAKMSGILVKVCKEDKWPAKAISCGLKAKDPEKECNDTLTAEQKKHMQDEMAKAMGMGGDDDKPAPADDKPADGEAGGDQGGGDEAAAGGGTGLPDCDAYVASMEKYMQCDKVPQAARDAAKQGMDAMKSGWGDMSGMPDDAKKQANDACKQAVDAMKQGAQAMGCEI
ncbi:MAG: hypothetical protein H6708_17215 [Kofleriaceae bacterium]|nr:hypothetical protein [Myxococcales bacterium]MCB9562147.1 hypothetical protein [Kofleriaceae bacterium]